eukprot:TRINITY_DN17201_c0_g1_i1.p1 TRINITY_DN17201_c0_g1~~TRINITY_DN17201_c0_g1_i1.p1  ORF type:complete len:105 (-),score=35.94 TRINITY_DN17201_c0_g1_i1:131-445(-)
MEFTYYKGDASENSDDSDNAEESVLYIQAEKVEDNTETSNEVEEALEEFVSSFRINTEMNIDEVFSRAKDHNDDLIDKQTLERKNFKKNQDESLAEFQYNLVEV